MNKKKQQSLQRKNRIRTKRQQKAAKDSRKRRSLLLDLNKMEELAIEQDRAAENG